MSFQSAFYEAGGCTNGNVLEQQRTAPLCRCWNMSQKRCHGDLHHLDSSGPMPANIRSTVSSIFHGFPVQTLPTTGGAAGNGGTMTFGDTLGSARQEHRSMKISG